MKKLILIALLFGFNMISFAQQTYTVNGKSYELKTELSGTIELLWNIIDGQYRYFAKKGDAIVELTNTKDENNKYQEEYKTILEGITTGFETSADKVKLTLPSLRNYIFEYNASQDPNYDQENKNASVQAKLLFFGGLTNSPFAENPDNIINPLFGAEIEIYEANNLPRHSLYLQFSHRLKSDAFDYSNSQFGLGYRFRFVNQESVQVYANLMAATYSIVNDGIGDSSNLFHAPFIFGVGADIKISETGYISIGYDELFALDLNNSGNFSTHFTLGYKLNL